MNVAVVGCGNVGSNLLQYIAGMPSIDGIFAIGREGFDAKVKAAILDVAGYKPRDAHKIIGANRSSLKEADIIVMTAGFKAEKGESPRETMKRNLSIVDHNLEGVKVKDSAIIINIGGPIEIVTSYLQRKSELSQAQVMGFGGDLDFNRLIYVLEERGFEAKGTAIVGEHGLRTIPVYDGGRDYDVISIKVRCFLEEIGELSGQKRNLATAPLLANLIRDVIEDTGRIHYISGYHHDYHRYITWPYRIGRRGILEPERLVLPSRAKRELDSLLELKDKEERDLVI